MEWDLTMRETVSLIFIGLGTFLIFTEGGGIIRLHAFFLCLSLPPPFSPFGAGLILVGSIIFFNDVSVTGRGIAIIIFILLTAPISAHMIGRAGYLDKYVDIWEGTKINELKGRYNLKTHSLAGMPTKQREKFERDTDNPT